MRIKPYLPIFFLFLMILGWSALIYFLRPIEIIDKIGIGGGYTALFLIAIIGALSSLTPGSVYPAMVTALLGGLNPILILIIAGVGMTIGDVIFFLISGKSREVLSTSFIKKIERFRLWLNNKPAWFSYVLIYIYIGLTPFPNNLLTGTLAVSGYKFKKLIYPLFLGNLSMPVLVTISTLLSQGII